MNIASNRSIPNINNQTTQNQSGIIKNIANGDRSSSAFIILYHP